MISGSVSPAWDPSSRTPEIRPDDDDEERNAWSPPGTERGYVQSPPPQMIKRPSGRPNRKGGYDLKQAAGLDNTLYDEIKVWYSDCLFTVADENLLQAYAMTLVDSHLNTTISWNQQSLGTRVAVMSLVSLLFVPLTIPDTVRRRKENSQF